MNLEAGESAEAAWSARNLSSVSLVVAWRAGTSRLECASAPLTTQVADELRTVCSQTLARLDARQERSWSPDAALEPDEYLLAKLSQLGDESEVLKVVTNEEFDILSANSLPNKDFLFYAVIAGPIDRRVAFIRKYNVRRGLRRRLVTLFGETLSKVDRPLFTFDDRFDVVVDPARGAAVLGIGAFQMLFRSSPEMLAKTPEFVSDIANALPMSGDSVATLISVASGNMNVNRRLQAIASRGHLEDVTLDMLKNEMCRHNLDVEKFIVDGKLTFDQADSKDILKLLNEDFFLGGLTSQPFQVDRKSQRT